MKKNSGVVIYEKPLICEKLRIYFSDYWLYFREGLKMPENIADRTNAVAPISNNYGEAVADSAQPARPPVDPAGPLINTRARIAVYDDLLSAPRIIDIEPAPFRFFVESIASQTYSQAIQLGGRLPYTTIREIAENFIHADFRECTVSILDRGNTIRFSDRGPGIEKKLLVLNPGVTSASDEMRRYIRGVGSGFPIVKEYLAINHGSLRIDDNAMEGTVITLSLQTAAGGTVNNREPAAESEYSETPTQVPAAPLWSDPLPVLSKTETSSRSLPPDQRLPLNPRSAAGVDAALPLDARALPALRITADLGAAGPTDLMEPLNISAPTATRLLQKLEDAGLLEKTANRKRILSNAGLSLLNRAGGY